MKKHILPMYSMDDVLQEEEDGHSSDGSISKSEPASKRSKTSHSTTAARSVTYTEMMATSSSSKVDTATKECFLCKQGLFSEIKGKSARMQEVERKIRLIIEKFIGISNTELMLSDICDVVNKDLRAAILVNPQAIFVDQTTGSVRQHMFKHIIDPALTARDSFDFWNTLFEQGKNTTLKLDENGNASLDKTQVEALIKIDQQRTSSMYIKDPRQSLFYNPGLTPLPKGTGGGGGGGGGGRGKF